MNTKHTTEFTAPLPIPEDFNLRLFQEQNAKSLRAALEKAFPDEVLAAHIEKLPPVARARLEKQFGPLPTNKKRQP